MPEQYTDKMADLVIINQTVSDNALKYFFGKMSQSQHFVRHFIVR